MHDHEVKKIKISFYSVSGLAGRCQEKGPTMMPPDSRLKNMVSPGRGCTVSGQQTASIRKDAGRWQRREKKAGSLFKNKPEQRMNAHRAAHRALWSSVCLTLPAPSLITDQIGPAARSAYRCAALTASSGAAPGHRSASVRLFNGRLLVLSMSWVSRESGLR